MGNTNWNSVRYTIHTKQNSYNYTDWQESGKNGEQVELSLIQPVGTYDLVQSLWKNCLAIFTKSKEVLTLLPSNFIPRYRPERKECICHPKTCRGIFVAALFITAQTGNNLNAH